MFVFFLFRADGGVSRNDFVMELLSTLTGQSIERPVQVEMSCLGAAFLAGLAAGVYHSILMIILRMFRIVAAHIKQ